MRADKRKNSPPFHPTCHKVWGILTSQKMQGNSGSVIIHAGASVCRFSRGTSTHIAKKKKKNWSGPVAGHRALMHSRHRRSQISANCMTIAWPYCGLMLDSALIIVHVGEKWATQHAYWTNMGNFDYQLFVVIIRDPFFLKKIIIYLLLFFPLLYKHRTEQLSSGMTWQD